VTIAQDKPSGREPLAATAVVTVLTFSITSNNFSFELMPPVKPKNRGPLANSWMDGPPFHNPADRRHPFEGQFF